MSPRFTFSLFISLWFLSAHPATAKDYLKLPLLHKTPPPSPTQTLLSDIHRLHHHQNTRKGYVKSPVVSGAPSGSGQYFVELRLGSPPQPLLLVADTGSDLLWLTCSACRHNCTPSHSPGSTFLARHSSSFSPHHCFDSACRLVPHPDHNPCNRSRLHSPCRYQYSYSDGSMTSGFFSEDMATLNTSSGREATLEKLSFGCGFQISGPSVSGASFNGAHGVMGLGRGSISFASQLGHRFGDKFSYCLMDYTLSPPPTSYLIIGDEQNTISSNPKMSFTPLLINPLSPTFYYIEIKSVKINSTKLRIDPSVWSLDEVGNGGTIVDSGTTLTFVPEAAYVEILTAIKRRVKLPSPGKATPGFDLCFNVTSEPKPKLPRLSLELSGGSVLKPPPMNYFIDTEEGIKCLAVQPVGKEMGFSVIGNLMQQGFLFEFDRDKSRLGFSRHGCTFA
ncbi:putative DNA binding protein [Hibiscus syriacus]|uniref:DNA binding protein n=1 Tax=Hibiscus syriacus TaxID=106335 RepID=A0A6A2WJ96_HIBSY|nr:aspartyl protease family protein 2-like [Hibiscus syriacus]KAE8659373.1 putative DNA binding protein [Hibiscus syriacus]